MSYTGLRITGFLELLCFVSCRFQVLVQSLRSVRLSRRDMDNRYCRQYRAQYARANRASHQCRQSASYQHSMNNIRSCPGVPE